MMLMSEDDQAPIDPAAAPYVYRVVADRIEQRIRSGEFGAGARLPNRGELAEHYGVAEMSIRRAHQELEKRGLIVIVPGKGVYVASGLG